MDAERRDSKELVLEVVLEEVGRVVGADILKVFGLVGCCDRWLFILIVRR